MQKSIIKYLFFILLGLAIVWPSSSFAAEGKWCYTETKGDSIFEGLISVVFGMKQKVTFTDHCYNTQAECLQNSSKCVLTKTDLMSDGKTGDLVTFDGGKCSLYNLSACAKQVVMFGMGIVNFILQWTFWLANQLFNISIKLNLTYFKDLANSSVITSIWATGRDVANIFFIFVMLYVAILTIVQSENGFRTKEMVVKIIITALLINFSIIIPKIIIDVGNSLAYVFYANMGTTDSFGTPDIGSVIARGKGMNPAALLQGDIKNLGASTTTQTTTDDPEWNNSLLRQVMTAVLFCILIYAFLVITFFFLARTVVLLFLIALSSLAFFSRVIGNGKYWDKWLSKLLSETFFAPFFLFLLYIALKMSANPIPLSENGIVGANLALGIMWYLIVCGLAFGSLFFSRSMASWSGQVLAKTGTKKLGTWSKNVAKRQTIGRAGNSLANSNAMKKFQAASPTLGGLAAAGANKMAQAGGWKQKVDADAAQNKSMPNTALRLTHLRNLSTFGELSQSQKEAYSKLSDKERAEMFKEAEKPGNESSLKLLNSLRNWESKRLTTGEQGLQKEQFSKLNTADKRFDYLFKDTVSADDREKLFKSLSSKDRIKLLKQAEETSATDPTNKAFTQVKEQLTAARQKIAEENAKEGKEMLAAEQSYDRTSKANSLLTSISAEKPADVGAISSAFSGLTASEMSDVVEKNQDKLAGDQGILASIKASHLSAINNNNYINQEFKQKLEEKIKSDFDRENSRYEQEKEAFDQAEKEYQEKMKVFNDQQSRQTNMTPAEQARVIRPTPPTINKPRQVDREIKNKMNWFNAHGFSGGKETSTNKSEGTDQK